MDRSPNFIDITIKEGGLRIHNSLLLDQVGQIAHELESAGIGYAEICHGRGIGGKDAGYPGLHTDFELLEAARTSAQKLKLCVYVAPEQFSDSKIASLAPNFDIGRVGVNVHQPEEAKSCITELKRLGKQIIGQILRIHARGPGDCAETAKKLADWGTDIIYLTDSYGSLETEEVRKYISTVKNAVKLPLGFQGKNNMDLAAINTLTAWQEGAQWLDGSILGMGQGAGVTALEKSVACFQAMGYCENIRLSDLCNAGKFFVKPALRSLPRIQHLDLLMAKHHLDFYPQDLLPSLSHVLNMDMEEFIKALKSSRKDLVELKENDLRSYLNSHKLDFDVVLEFLKTGKISGE